MKILVAAQDPGGANAVAPVAIELLRRGENVFARAYGAARDIFAARGIPFDTDADPALVIVGTSGGESIEKNITAEMRGTAPTIAVLDFWSNYWQRFSSPEVKDLMYLPDLVCVIDGIAKTEMIAEGFPAERIVITGNPHFDHFADKVTCGGEDSKRILYISEPIREDAVSEFISGNDEYTALEAAIAALPEGHTLSIRLHPRDSAGKYDRYLQGSVTIALEKTLEEALSVSGLILGTASQVLLQAVAAGKKVLSYEPALAGPDRMVSNNLGITTRIESPQELAAALKNYAAGKWPYLVRPMREVWPAGATERVVEAALALATI